MFFIVKFSLPPLRKLRMRNECECSIEGFGDTVGSLSRQTKKFALPPEKSCFVFLNFKKLKYPCWQNDVEGKHIGGVSPHPPPPRVPT